MATSSDVVCWTRPTAQIARIVGYIAAAFAVVTPSSKDTSTKPSMRLQLDSCLQAPAGWTHVVSADHAISLLTSNVYDLIMINSSMQCNSGGWHDIISWLESKRAADTLFVPPDVIVVNGMSLRKTGA